MSKPRKFLDALEAVSDDSDDDSSSSGDDAGGSGDAGTAAAAAGAAADGGGGKRQGGAGGGDADGAGGAQKRQRKGEVTLEQLQAAGYEAGPSVLHMRPPEDEAAAPVWAVGDGRTHKQHEREAADESLDERRRTHAAATSAAEESARLALRAAAHASKLREEALAEREAQRQKSKPLSWNQKEKAKRDRGMASRGKSTVEEEKRIARQMGVYSGFD